MTWRNFGIPRPATQEGHRHQTKKPKKQGDYQHQALVALLQMILFAVIIIFIGWLFLGSWDHKLFSLSIFCALALISIAGFHHYYMEFREARAVLRGPTLKSQV